MGCWPGIVESGSHGLRGRRFVGAPVQHWKLVAVYRMTKMTCDERAPTPLERLDFDFSILLTHQVPVHVRRTRELVSFEGVRQIARIPSRESDLYLVKLEDCPENVTREEEGSWDWTNCAGGRGATAPLRSRLRMLVYYEVEDRITAAGLGVSLT